MGSLLKRGERNLKPSNFFFAGEKVACFRIHWPEFSNLLDILAKILHFLRENTIFSFLSEGKKGNSSKQELIHARKNQS